MTRPTTTLTGATMEDILTAPVEAQHVPIGALYWDGVKVHKVIAVRRLDEEEDVTFALNGTAATFTVHRLDHLQIVVAERPGSRAVGHRPKSMLTDSTFDVGDTLPNDVTVLLWEVAADGSGVVLALRRDTFVTWRVYHWNGTVMSICHGNYLGKDLEGALFDFRKRLKDANEI